MKHLITAEDISSRTVVQVNVDDHKLTIYVPLAESRHLRPLLGHVLFNELLLFIQAETPDVLDPLAALAEQAKDMLSNWAAVEAWPTLKGHVTNAGITVKNGKDVSTQADRETVAEMLEAVRGTAEFHSSELTIWINARKDDYPSYRPQGAAVAPSMPLCGLDLD